MAMAMPVSSDMRRGVGRPGSDARIAVQHSACAMYPLSSLSGVLRRKRCRKVWWCTPRDSASSATEIPCCIIHCCIMATVIIGLFGNRRSLRCSNLMHNLYNMFNNLSTPLFTNPINKSMNDKMIAIIPAAGLGGRLGQGKPKSLVKVCGKPIIQWQLEALGLFSEVRVVVGYQGEDVVRTAHASHPKVTFYLNQYFQENSVVDSILMAMRDLKPDELVTVIDGDVLFTAEQIELMARNKFQCIGATKERSEYPVMLCTTGATVYGFSRDITYGYEWACICNAYPSIFKDSDKYIYNGLQRQLPLPYVLLDTVEVDTPTDLAEAELWIQERRSNQTVLGAAGGRR